MDDPKETKQGTPGQDARLSSGRTEGTSQDIPETLTREAAQKLVSDALAKQGRELKAAKTEAESYKTAHSKLESELNETKEKMNEIQRRIDEAEEEEAKNSPESLRLYQRQRQLREDEAKLKEGKRQLEKERQEHTAELTEAREGKMEMAIISMAVEHHIDIGKLKEKCQRFNLTTEEQISEMAETLAEQAQTGGDSKKKIPQGDSGRTIGGGTEDSLKARYPSMYQ